MAGWISTAKTQGCDRLFASCDAFRFGNAVAGDRTFVHPVDCQQPDGFSRHAVFYGVSIGSQLWKIGCETSVRVRAGAGFVVDDGVTLRTSGKAIDDAVDL